MTTPLHSASHTSSPRGGMWRRALALAVALGCVAAGWRVDGSARVAGATPPRTWDTPLWTAPLRTSGNASPVVYGSSAFVTAEPTQLVAVDVASGAVRWRRSHAVLDALPPDLAAVIRPVVDAAPAAQSALAEARRQYALLARAARAGDPTAKEGLVALDATIASWSAQVDAARPYLTPDTHDGVGYASPTPAAANGAVYALFGNGVVASHTSGGELRWRRWLGTSKTEKRGYKGVDAASPVLVGGLLIVPYGRLLALDARTGETRWSGPAYPHFGTPLVTRVGARDVLVLPDGVVLDAATGAVQPAVLDSVYYCAPTAFGDQVFYAGSASGWESMDPVFASSWRLSEGAGGVVAERLWRVTLPSRDRVYAGPVVDERNLYIVSRFKRLVVLDRADGALRHEAVLTEKAGEVWAGPVLAGDRLHVFTVQGLMMQIGLGEGFPLVAEQSVSPSAASPWYDGTMALWRGRDALFRFDGGGP
jgi:outer membrane protein assembly factor BamB